MTATPVGVVGAGDTQRCSLDGCSRWPKSFCCESGRTNTIWLATLVEPVGETQPDKSYWVRALTPAPVPAAVVYGRVDAAVGGGRQAQRTEVVNHQE